MRNFGERCELLPEIRQGLEPILLLLRHLPHCVERLVLHQLIRRASPLLGGHLQMHDLPITLQLRRFHQVQEYRGRKRLCVLASVLLGEVISRAAIGASVLGFAGTLVIVGGRIGQGEFDEGAALGVASLFVSALLYAYNFIVIRRQAQVAGPLEIATFHSGIGGLVLLTLAPFLWETPSGDALVPLLAAGALTVAGSLAIAWAYARAEANVLVPTEYSGFVWASIFGWLFFREAVTLPTLAGTALIVG